MATEQVEDWIMGSIEDDDGDLRNVPLPIIRAVVHRTLEELEDLIPSVFSEEESPMLHGILRLAVWKK
jgi:hypothetical protein